MLWGSYSVQCARLNHSDVFCTENSFYVINPIAALFGVFLLVSSAVEFILHGLVLGRIRTVQLYQFISVVAMPTPLTSAALWCSVASSWSFS